MTVFVSIVIFSEFFFRVACIVACLILSYLVFIPLIYVPLLKVGSFGHKHIYIDTDNQIKFFKSCPFAVAPLLSKKIANIILWLACKYGWESPFSAVLFCFFYWFIGWPQQIKGIQPGTQMGSTFPIHNSEGQYLNATPY